MLKSPGWLSGISENSGKDEMLSCEGVVAGPRQAPSWWEKPESLAKFFQYREDVFKSSCLS